MVCLHVADRSCEVLVGLSSFAKASSGGAPALGLSLTTRALTTSRRRRNRPAASRRHLALGKDSFAPRSWALERPLLFRAERLIRLASPPALRIVRSRPASRRAGSVHTRALSFGAFVMRL
jgi:hypothetical protein